MGGEIKNQSEVVGKVALAIYLNLIEKEEIILQTYLLVIFFIIIKFQMLSPRLTYIPT